MNSARRSAFTLVELLVVIAIIGILVSLLMPAVQSAREAGRRNTCSNNCRTMVTGALHHEQAQGFWPTGGWGWNWAGDPDRGYGIRQPGGWHYNILPYIEQQALHDLGLNGDPGNTGKTQCMQTPVSQFACPSRRPIKAYAYVHGNAYFNTNQPQFIGRSDYAACGGDNGAGVPVGPGSLSQGDGMSQTDWNNNISGDVYGATGVSFVRSQLPSALITDGLSNTYFLGERYIDPDNYESGNECDDDQGWDQGYDFDTYRWTNIGQNPLEDTPGYGGGCNMNFGSAHTGTFQMAFCDGSVHNISYSIDPEVHRRLGNRKDGLPVDGSKF